MENTATAHWDTAVATGAMRIGAGAALLRWRDPIIRMTGGSPTDPVVKAVFTYFGVRDIVLGVSALAATRPNSNVPRQLVNQGLADTVDTAILTGLVTAGRLPRARGSGAAALAAGTAVSGYAVAWRLRRMS
jgi:hypothetical protein